MNSLILCISSSWLQNSAQVSSVLQTKGAAAQRSQSSTAAQVDECEPTGYYSLF